MDAHYLRGLGKEVAERLQKQGIAATLFKAARYAIGIGGSNPRQDEFDRVRGVYTSRVEPVWKLGIRSPNLRFAQKYAPVEAVALAGVLARLEPSWSGATFVDLGCGKGRALIIAAEAGFGQVVGVELSSKLVVTARKNLETLRIANAKVVQGDASKATFETQNMVLFLNNPFGPEVMALVADQIRAAPHKPRYIIYFNPFYSEPIDALSGYNATLQEPGIRVWKLPQ